MSSYIVEDKTIDVIIWGLNQEFCTKYSYGKKAMPYFKNVNDLGRALVKMNLKAVNQRYNEKQKAVFTGYKVPEKGRQKIVQVLKSLECYLYQCSEGTVPRMRLYKSLERSKACLRIEIIRNLPAYQKAGWG